MAFKRGISVIQLRMSLLAFAAVSEALLLRVKHPPGIQMLHFAPNNKGRHGKCKRHLLVVAIVVSCFQRLFAKERKRVVSTFRKIAASMFRVRRDGKGQIQSCPTGKLGCDGKGQCKNPKTFLRCRRATAAWGLSRKSRHGPKARRAISQG